MFAEPLESRRLLATVIWDGGPTGTGTDFNTAANWVGDVRPGVDDDAVIGAGSTILALTASTQVHTIQSAREIQISLNAILQTSDVNQMSAPITISVGQLQGGIWNFVGSGARLNIAGSTLLSDTTVTGTADMRDLTYLHIAGATSITTLVMRLGNNVFLDGGASLRAAVIVNSPMSTQSTINFGTGSIAPASTISVMPGSLGTLRLIGESLANSGDIRSEVAGFSIVITPTTFFNFGSLHASNGGIISYEPVNSFSIYCENDGLIHVRSGGLVHFATVLANSGLIDLSEGTLALGGTYVSNALFDPQHYTFAHSQVVFEGTLDNRNTDLNFDDLPADIVFSSATVIGGTTTWSDAHAPRIRANSMFGPPTIFRDVHVLRSVFLSGDQQALTLAGTTTIDGTMEVQNARIGISTPYSLDFRLLLHTTGIEGSGTDTLTITPQGSIEYEVSSNIGSRITFSIANYGLIQSVGSQGGPIFSGTRFDNFGTVRCGASCVLNLDFTTIVNNGLFEGLANSRFTAAGNWSSPGVVQLHDCFFALGSGTIYTSTAGLERFTRVGGTLMFRSIVIENAEQSLTLDAAIGSICFDAVEIRGGTLRQLDGARVYIDSQISVLPRIWLQNVTVTEPLTIAANGSLFLRGTTRAVLIQMGTGSSLYAFENGYVLRDRVELIDTDEESRTLMVSNIGSTGSIVSMPGYVGNASFYFYDSSTLTNNGLLDLRSAAFGCPVINNGTMRWSSPGTVSISYSFTNAGTLDFGGVTATIQIQLTNTGVIYVHDRATINTTCDGWRNDGIIDISASVFQVNAVSSGNLMHNFGTIISRPGSAVRFVVGTLVNEASGALQWELGGTGVAQIGRITTDGAVLNGTLRLHFASGFTPAIISSYTFLITTAGHTLSVNFSTMDLPTPAVDGKNFIRTVGTQLRLFVSSAADFNSDGIVDQSDYQAFYNAFAAGGTGADFNGDGVIDMFDYLDFVRIYARR